MKKLLFPILFGTTILASSANANDLVAIFDPCAFELSEIKDNKEQSLATLTAFADLPKEEVGTGFLDLAKTLWLERNSETFQSGNFTETQITLLWDAERQAIVNHYGGADAFNTKAAEAADAQAAQITENYNAEVEGKKASCDTDFLHSAGRVANNFVKLQLTLAGSLLGEEGAKAGNNLGKYLTGEKNGFKAVGRLGQKIFSW